MGIAVGLARRAVKIAVELAAARCEDCHGVGVGIALGLAVAVVPWFAMGTAAALPRIKTNIVRRLTVQSGHTPYPGSSGCFAWSMQLPIFGVFCLYTTTK